MTVRKKKSRHTGLIIGMTLLLLAALAAAAGAGWYFMVYLPGQPKAEDTFNAYVEAVEAGNYEAIYDMVHPDVGQSIDRETLTARYTNILGGIDARNVKITPVNSEEKNDRWTFNFRMSMDTATGNMDNGYSMEIVKDDQGQYKILWSSNLIFPALKDTDKVRVNTLEASRGTIYDRNGSPLAVNGTAASIGLVPGKISTQTGDEDLDRLAEILEVSREFIDSQLGASWVTSDVFVPIRTVAADDQEMIDQALTVQGVMVNETPSREYPLGSALAHLTGYVQGISAEELEAMSDQGYDSESVIGKAGLEQLYESTLKGEDGCEILILNSDGTKKETLGYKAAVNGQDIYLNIDTQLQLQLYEALGEDKGLAVAMNMKTGEVMALASTPSYNPNEFVAGILTSRWEELNSNEGQPFYNRYASSWAPGSVFKPITAAIGLTNKTIDPNAVEPSNGLSWQKDSSWGNLTVTTLETYGDVTLKKAIAYSDNIYFAKKTIGMGRDAFVSGLDAMGFGEALPFTIGLANSTYGTLRESNDEILLGNSGYGQGEMLVNPVHLASIYTAFKNDGDIIVPQLMKDSEITFWKENVFDSEAVNTVADAMRMVISEGTGTEAQISSLALAGKTGTAEIKASQDDTTGTELGWFLAYEADNNDDPLLILMMIEDVKDRGGSHYVMPKVRDVFSLYRGVG